MTKAGVLLLVAIITSMLCYTLLINLSFHGQEGHTKTLHVWKETPLLVIFTTFKNTQQKYNIHRNTILNWASFVPKVQPILFANLSKNSKLKKLALLNGWQVIHLERVNKDGTPYLKDMYHVTGNVFKSKFYGFCNSDIVFNQGLISTLEGVSNYLTKFNSTLIIGRRHNVNVTEHSSEALFDSSNVAVVAKKHGVLFIKDAEDFFFIAKLKRFPWHIIKDIVIGRPAYDNYLVGQAIRNGVTVVDATNTLVAVHQTDKDGNYAGKTGKNKDRNYNLKLIGNYNYDSGRTSSAQYVTTLDIFDGVFLQKRYFH